MVACSRTDEIMQSLLTMYRFVIKAILKHALHIAVLQSPWLELFYEDAYAKRIRQQQLIAVAVTPYLTHRWEPHEVAECMDHNHAGKVPCAQESVRHKPAKNGGIRELEQHLLQAARFQISSTTSCSHNCLVLISVAQMSQQALPSRLQHIGVVPW